MNLVDSHCHLNMLPGADTPEGLDAIVEAAGQAGVTHMLCISVDLETYPEVLAIARRYDHVRASVGVHPNHGEGREPDVDQLVALAADPQVVAIGETGLDYFRSEGDEEAQRQRFRVHIEAARRSGKPLIVHTREAKADTLALMAEAGAQEPGGVLHCFTEDWDMAKAALDLNFYISFSGIVTFKNAEALREVARKVPLERMLIETDSPYLAPVPHRGKPNQPAFVAYVAQCIADLRGMAPEALAERTRQNYFELFRAA